MKPLGTTRVILLTTVFAVLPYRPGTDLGGHFAFVPAFAHAESGSGSDGDGGDDGEGGDDGGDDGEGGDDGGDDGEGGDDGGDDGEGGDDGDDGDSGDSGDDGDDGEGDDDGDKSGRDNSRDSRGGKPQPTKAQKLSDGARITFSDGTREEVRNGEFVRRDGKGRVVERRRARSSDVARMRALFGGQKPKTEKTQPRINSRAVKATYRGANVEILYSNGWREEISSGRYQLIDQYGRVAASRKATQADRTRLNRFRK